MNALLAGLLLAALALGWRLNRRLAVLRDSHDGFEAAVRELNTAAARAEQGLADLRAATDEATDLLADRIDKGRTLAAKLERLIDNAPPLRTPSPASTVDAMTERRLGALLAAARDARPERLTAQEPAAGPAVVAGPISERTMPPRRRSVEDELFDDEPLTLNDVRGARS